MGVALRGIAQVIRSVRERPSSQSGSGFAQALDGDESRPETDGEQPTTDDDRQSKPERLVRQRRRRAHSDGATGLKLDVFA